MSKVIFYFKFFIYRFILKKDPMKIKVEYYRSKGVKIGENMRTFSVLSSAEPYLLEFGDNVTVSSGVSFITHDNSATKIIPDSTDIIGRIKIGNNCFIGQRSLFLPGVEIGNDVVVAAGSVVTKSFLTEGVIIGGNPAKVIGTVEDYRLKYSRNAFNTKGLDYQRKKEIIQNNEKKLLKK